MNPPESLMLIETWLNENKFEYYKSCLKNHEIFFIYILPDNRRIECSNSPIVWFTGYSKQNLADPKFFEKLEEWLNG